VASWSARLRRRLGERADLLGAALAALAFGGHLLLTDEYFFGAGTDVLSFEYPLHAFASEWLRRGVLPLWNPFLFGGVPFQTGVHGYLYPGLWTGLALPAGFDFKLGIVLHLVLAAVGATWFARGRVASRLAALLAGTTFALSAFPVVHLYAGHRTLLTTAAWLPWVAGCLDRSLRGRGSLRAGVLASGLMWLSAQYQIVFVSLGGVLLFFLLEALVGERAEDPARPDLRARGRAAARVALHWGGVALFGALLAAVQLLPALRSAGLSQRTGGGGAFAASFSSAPQNLLTYVVPDLFGSRVDAPFVGAWSYWESLGYVGLVPLALTLVGVAALPWRRWLPAALVAALALAVAMGRHTPLFGVWLALVPGAGLFRAPGRLTLLASWLLGLLAALALQGWREGRLPPRRLAAGVLLLAALSAGTAALLPALDPADPGGLQARLSGSARWRALGPDELAALDARPETLLAAAGLAGVCLLLVAGASRGPCAGAAGASRGRAAGAAALALLALHLGDLYVFGHRFLGTAPAERFELPDALVRHLRRDGPGARVIPPPGRRWDDLVAVAGLASPGGFETFIDRRYARYLNRSQDRPLGHFFTVERIRRGSPLLRHLGVGALLSTEPLREGRGGGFEGFPWLAEEAVVAGVHVLRDAGAAPRAALVHRFEVVPREEDAYRRLESPDFDLRASALLDAEPPADFARPLPPPPGARESARITRYEPNRVELEVEAAAPALLVLSDVLQPGWRARVGDEPAPLVHANRVMRALPVPAGRHRVVMTYLPRELLVGAALSGVSLLLLVAGGQLAPRGRGEEPATGSARGPARPGARP
jgi:hypothetical protein